MHTRNPPRTPFLAGLLIITSISPLLSSLTNTPIPTLQTSYVTAPITAFSYLFIGIGLLITFEESLRIEHSCITTTGYITASLHTALTTFTVTHAYMLTQPSANIASIQAAEIVLAIMYLLIYRAVRPGFLHEAKDDLLNTISE